MASNQAAWIDGKDKPLEVRDADMPQPGADEIVVKNHAIAINPVDWKMQDGFYLEQLKLPFIIGADVAGEIHDVGSAVKGFKKGDRVLAHCTNLLNKKSQSGAFQLYSAANSTVASKIPSHMKFADATVLPLAISTAAMGLYAADYLNLPPPQVSPKPANKAILIWGGSSSVGAVAIQLARASGLIVITTASSHNLDAMKTQLGAHHAFDYKSAMVLEDVVHAAEQLKEGGTEFVGVYDAISVPASLKTVGQIFDRLGANKIVTAKKAATVLPPNDLPGDVEAKGVVAALLVGPYRNVAEAVWEKFVPEALDKGILRPFPPPLVVGQGLESVQKGMDENKRGVSFAKIVVEV